ncbi:Abi-alpha family protein [Sulfuricurvum sp.]|uniref:Abi-alpha family protein n=1 Tax=Sulfuricurvum sp. TaxID=2025608 RepID=UPI00260B46A1|nr:Abi-alpha family protein [Sulfuricurvum sp.]MDD4950880.1 Abi-alpha family protein [Sulfuricurvum sp.]
MSDEKDKSLDVFGIKPVAKSVEKVTDATVDGARAFMARICLPAAEEFGLLLQDYVKSWRASNAAKVAQKAEQKVVMYHTDADVKVHPRIAHNIFEEGSWIEDETIQDMWAGLLASSCEVTGLDDSNLIFVAILKQLTALQVRVIRYAIENSNKYVSEAGWPYADNVQCPLNTLKAICQTEDVIRIDRELDYLRSMELIGSGIGSGGFSPDGDIADISPTPLALNLYVRGEGFIGSPIDFWSLEKKGVKN